MRTLKSGSYNFDIGKVKKPFTGEPKNKLFYLMKHTIQSLTQWDLTKNAEQRQSNYIHLWRKYFSNIDFSYLKCSNINTKLYYIFCNLIRFIWQEYK